VSAAERGPWGRGRVLLAGALLLCVALVAGVLFLQGTRGSAGDPGATAAATATPQPTTTQPTTTQATTLAPEVTHTPRSGLPRVAESALPEEARETLRLIDDGGPYPFRQDDGTFFNREGHLPAQGRGYYREYTVQTPRSPDRGARRIVAGADGDLYYTDDHYDSFRQIAEGE